MKQCSTYAVNSASEVVDPVYRYSKPEHFHIFDNFPTTMATHNGNMATWGVRQLTFGSS